MPWLNPAHRELETDELKETAGQWNPTLELNTAQDEYAIAVMMAGM